MVERAMLEDILRKAVNAPSGDNAQPWEFSISENTVNVFNVVGRDATLYNFRERGSYLGHGALIENICVLARAASFEPTVTLFPGEANCVAKISFAPVSMASENLLAAAIERRVSNRKPYQKTSFATADKRVVADSVTSFNTMSLRFVEGPDIATVADAISTNERILFENRPLHDFLFSMIRWTEGEEHIKPGLYILTMEFPPPLRFLFRYVFNNFDIVNVLNQIGLSKFIPKQSAQGYAASSAIGAIVGTSDTNADFVTAGRAFERMWLTLTAQGLWLQPVGAIPYLMQRIEAGEAQDFSSEHIELIKNAYATMAKSFNLAPGEKIMMMFRIGYGAAPTARSAKLPPVIRG
jgi:hypothetical protein